VLMDEVKERRETSSVATAAWVLQTWVVGYPSLRLLLRRWRLNLL
jgi:hypothetical protein